MQGKSMSFRIDSHTIVTDKGPKHVLYHIAVETSANNWTIERRYTQLREFKDKVLDLPTLQMDKYLHGLGIKSELPFPKKMLFSNFNPKKIADRQQKLETYLNRLSELTNLADCKEACTFLEVETFTQTLLRSLVFEKEENKEQEANLVEWDITREDSEDPVLGVGRKEVVRIYDFLKRLNNEPLKIANAVQDFEEYFFANQLELTKDEIQYLLWGDANLRGLLHFCGDVDKYITSSSCMQFFSKLLKFEYNSEEAEKFVNVFCMTAPELVKQMKLGHYITSITSHDSVGLVAVYYYLNYNPHGISEAEDLLDDTRSIEEYNKWLQNKVTCGKTVPSLLGYLFKPSKRKPSSHPSEQRLRLAEAVEEKENLPELLAKSLGEAKITNNVLECSQEASTGEAKTLLGYIDNYASWELISGASSESLQAFTKGKKCFRLTLRLKTEDVVKAARLFFVLERREKWEKVQYNVIKKEGESQDTVEILYKQSLGKARYIEYIVSRSLTIAPEAQTATILARSLLLPQSALSYVKRVHISAALSHFALKTDLKGAKYVECQSLWITEEGNGSLAEYLKCMARDYDAELLVLNHLLAEP